MNHTAARYKLMRRMLQDELCFTEWYPRVKGQAERRTWEAYNADMADRDAISYPTQDKKLQQKIMAEGLSYANMMKYGLYPEQGK